ncbi:hypothetical protein V1478_012796 [Vespula squamosa]|uniref:Uncharacterized protein n=1 Tax=Vespula squamosa TaxID=30214 RepID=A0ABD2A9M5_VESSQ
MKNYIQQIRSVKNHTFDGSNVRHTPQCFSLIVTPRTVWRDVRNSNRLNFVQIVRSRISDRSNYFLQQLRLSNMSLRNRKFV